jgi:hypothetical protein
VTVNGQRNSGGDHPGGARSPLLPWLPDGVSAPDGPSYGKGVKNAFASFQERYVLAGLYAQEDRQMDVAAEVGDCLSELRQHARMMWAFEAIGDRVASTKEREAFYGPAVILPFAPQPDDPIEARLKRAEQALQSELRPILALKTRQGRLRRILATRRGKRCRPGITPMIAAPYR